MGLRALEIARRLKDVKLRILTASLLGFTHFVRGEYGKVVELATENLAVLPSDWVHESFGGFVPVSIRDRVWLVMSLAHLGRFAEAADSEAALVHLAEPTQHPHAIGLAHFAMGRLHTCSTGTGRRRTS